MRSKLRVKLSYNTVNNSLCDSIFTRPDILSSYHFVDDILDERNSLATMFKRTVSLIML